MQQQFRKSAVRAAISRNLGNPSDSQSFKSRGFANRLLRGQSRSEKIGPVVHRFQSSPTDCGSACLAMVAGAWGIDLSPRKLDALFGNAANGTSLRGLIRAADAVGLSARPVRVGLGRLADLQLPAILHWEMNHFVVLERVDDEHLLIADPALGKLEIPLHLADDKFTGVAVEISRHSDVQPIRDAESSPPSLMSIDRRLVRQIMATSLIMLLLQAAILAQPFLLRDLVVALSKPADHGLILIFSGLAGLLGMQFALNLLRARALDALGIEVTRKFSLRVMGLILAASPDFIRRRAESSVSMQIQSLETIRRSVVDEFIPAGADAVILLFAAILAAVFNPAAGAIILIFVISDTAIRLSNIKSEARAAASIINANSSESAYLYDTTRGFQSIKIFGGEETRLSQWRSILLDISSAQSAVLRGRALRSSLSSILLPMEFTALILIATGAHQSTSGIATLFGIFAFRSIIREKTSSLLNLAPSYLGFRERMARLDYLRHANPERGKGHAPVRPGLSTIELSEVTYRIGEAAPLLDGLSLTVHPGEFIVISGKSGSGKSTLVRLLLGFTNPMSGTIRYGDSEIANSDLRSWRDNFSALLQEDILFNGSIAENIALFEPTTNLERIRSTARMAEIDDEIMSMPMNYLTPIAEGTALLSAGQRQRILIARAIYRNSPVTVLDEGTAHVDSECERRIAKALTSIKGTRIVIAHRSALFSFADRILELENGKLREVTQSSRSST